MSNPSLLRKYADIVSEAMQGSTDDRLAAWTKAQEVHGHPGQSSEDWNRIESAASIRSYYDQMLDKYGSDALAYIDSHQGAQYTSAKLEEYNYDLESMFSAEGAASLEKIQREIMEVSDDINDEMIGLGDNHGGEFF